MNTKLDILKKIQSGEIDMKPRWHFVLKSLLLLLSIVTIILLVIYILSFIFFIFRQSGVGFVSLYGFRGLSIFVINSPWLLIVLAVTLVVVLQLLVHKYSFSYHQPLLYSFLGLILLVLFGAYAIGQTQFNPRLQGFVKDRNIPVFGPLYRGIDERRPESIVFGTIIEITNDGFVLESDRGETLHIIITRVTKGLPNKIYTIDETVLVFGDRKGETIIALGVRPAPVDFDFNKHDKNFGRGLQK